MPRPRVDPELKRARRQAYAQAYIARNRERLRAYHKARMEEVMAEPPEVLPGQYLHAQCGTLFDSAAKAFIHLRMGYCENLLDHTIFGG